MMRSVRTPRISAVGTATPRDRFTRAEVLPWSGYTDSLRQGFFLNSEIKHRYLFLDGESFVPNENVDHLNARFEAGSLEGILLRW
jgi:hypothetical protein